MKRPPMLTTTALALAGAGLWTFAGSSLNENKRFDFSPNPLGINMSPYGAVIAMAVQAPIDADWHSGIESHGGDQASHVGCDHEGCDHTTHGSHDPHNAGDVDCEHEGCDHSSHPHTPAIAKDDAHRHGSQCADDCTHDHEAGPSEAPVAVRSFIARLNAAVSKRTNPHAPSAAHRLYLRSEIEKKLRFAYLLDPSHYANYNAYHMFLVYAELGTQTDGYEESSSRALELDRETIRYCLREANDPRPSLTAASAAVNSLELMFNSPDRHSIAEMHEMLATARLCVRRHFELLEATTRNGTWELLSPMRQEEILTRGTLNLRLFEAAEKIVEKLERESQASHEPS